MDDETAQRIHVRIDETHKLINEVKLTSAEQCRDMKNLTTNVNNFIEKVDKSIFDTEVGFIVKTKTKLSSFCTQIKNQWYLIGLLLLGVFGIAWGVICELYKVRPH